MSPIPIPVVYIAVISYSKTDYNYKYFIKIDFVLKDIKKLNYSKQTLLILT